MSKTTKKKQLKSFDVKPKIKSMQIVDNDDGISVTLLLPAGSEDNINPSIIFDKAWESVDFEIKSVVRGKLYDKNMQSFH